MGRKENEATAERVFQYWKNVTNYNTKSTVDHFILEGFNPQSLRRMIRRFKVSGNAIYKKLSGRPAVKSSRKQVNRVLREFRINPNASVRGVAKKLGLSASTVSRIKVDKLGIKARVKMEAPKYTGNQEQRAKKGARKIYQKVIRKTLVIDDETYVPVDPSDVPGRKFFHSADPALLNFEQKFKQKGKFPKKFLIWQAMDEDGNVSEPYISDGNMNSEIYLKHCVKVRLVPFINRHHETENILFWPDLATPHYGRIVTDYLTSKNIHLVSKAENAPNIPQARGIEKFWALCKSRYSQRKTQPKSLTGFKRIWSKISKEVAQESGKAVMAKARSMLIAIGYKGVKQALMAKTK